MITIQYKITRGFLLLDHHIQMNRGLLKSHSGPHSTADIMGNQEIYDSVTDIE